jgi:hypothetical protein
MKPEEIIQKKRSTNKFGCKAREFNLARIIANRTGYKVDTIARILNGVNKPTKPHHFRWLRMAERILITQIDDDAN